MTVDYLPLLGVDGVDTSDKWKEYLDAWLQTKLQFDIYNNNEDALNEIGRKLYAIQRELFEIVTKLNLTREMNLRS